MIETDCDDIRDEISKSLIEALYANNRIYNKRYSLVNIKPDRGIRIPFYDNLYKSSFGGAIIVHYITDDDSEDDYADCSRENIELICKTMKKYRNNVMTVICLPRECTKTKEVFYEQLLNVSLVELREDLASVEKSVDFLKMLAEKQKIQADDDLFSKLRKEKGYLSHELRNLFDEWYDKKLKTEIFPQYKDLTAVNHKIAESAPQRLCL